MPITFFIIPIICLIAFMSGLQPLYLPGVYLGVKTLFLFSDSLLLESWLGVTSSRLFLIVFAAGMGFYLFRNRTLFSTAKIKDGWWYLLTYFIFLLLIPSLHHLAFYDTLPLAHLKFYTLSSWGIFVALLTVKLDRLDRLWNGFVISFFVIFLFLLYPTLKFFGSYGYLTGISLHRLDPFVDLFRFFKADVSDYFYVIESGQSGIRSLFLWLNTEISYYYTLLLAVVFTLLIIKLFDRELSFKKRVMAYVTSMLLLIFSLLFNYLALSLMFFVTVGLFLLVRFFRKGGERRQWGLTGLLVGSLLFFFSLNEVFLTKTSSGITLLERLIAPYVDNYWIDKNNKFTLHYRSELERRNASGNMTRLMMVRIGLTNTWLNYPVSGIGYLDKQKLRNMDPSKPMYVSWNSFLLDKLSIWGFFTGFLIWLPFLFPFMLLVKYRLVRRMPFAELILFLNFFTASFWAAGAGSFGYITGAIGIQNFMIIIFLRRVRSYYS